MKPTQLKTNYIWTALSALGIVGLLLLPWAGVETALGKPTTLYMGALVYLFLIALWTLCRQKTTWRINRVDALAAALLVCIVVNYLFCSTVVATTKLIHLLWMGFLYLNLRIIFTKNRHAALIVLCALLLCGLQEAVMGIRQAFGFAGSHHNLFRVTGTFFNPGPYGGYLAVVLAVALGYLCAHRGAFSRIQEKGIRTAIKSRFVCLYLFCLITAIPMLIILPATLNRAAFVSVIGCFSVICLRDSTFKRRLKSMTQHNRQRLRILCGVTIPVALLLGAGLYLVKQNSANGRLLMWSVATSMATDHPICGVGFGAFQGAYAHYQAQYFTDHPDSKLVAVADCPEYAFNEYLLRGAELGLVGLFLFLGLIGLALRELMKHHNALAYGLLALLIFSFFSYPLSLNTFQILLMVFICLGTTQSNRTPKTPLALHRGWLIGALLLSALVVAFSMRVMQQKQKAEAEAEKISYIYRMDVYDDILPDYRALYPLLNDHPKFLFEYGRSLNQLGLHRESNCVLGQGAGLSSDPMFYNVMGNNYKALKQYELAEYYYTLSASILPNRLYPHYLLMKLYQESAQTAHMYAMAKKVVGFDPKITSSATQSMKKEAQTILDQPNSP